MLASVTCVAKFSMCNFGAKTSGEQERAIHRPVTVNANALCDRIASILPLIDR